MQVVCQKMLEGNPRRMAHCDKVVFQTDLKIMSDNRDVYSCFASHAPKSNLARLGCSPLSLAAEVSPVRALMSLKITSRKRFAE